MPPVRTCERCKKDFSAKMRLCPFCGKLHRDPATKEKAVCPKCRVGLEKAVYRENNLDVCPQCKGVWLDVLEFEHLTSEKDVYADEESSTHFETRPPENASRLFECVRCDTMMNRTNFRTISGILVDICIHHGVWLDAGELGRIRNFVASGGLDRSQDREIRKNASEIRRLAVQVDDLKFMQKMLHRWSPRMWFFG